jgi:hypothetical protein
MHRAPIVRELINYVRGKPISERGLDLCARAELENQLGSDDVRLFASCSSNPS